MNLEKPVKTNQQVNKMVAADEQATAYSDEDSVIVKCQNQKEEEEEEPPEIEPFCLLMWNIKELGGGFYMPASRPAHCIDAYAAVISKLNIDICVLMGVRKNRGTNIVEKPMADNTTCFCLEPPDENTGVKEVDRILNALKQTDSAGGWTCAFLKSEDNVSVVYQEQSTTCFLYKSAKGIELLQIELVKGKREDRIGLPEELLCATFRVPAGAGVPPVEVSILAPLAVFESQRFGKGDNRSDNEDQLQTKGGIPEQCILAISTPCDLVSSLGGFNAFRATVDADYQLLLNQGTILKEPHWETIVEKCDYLIDNLLSLNPTDVRLQDQTMHWEALDLPDHPYALNKVVGHLSDLFLVRNGTSGKPLIFEEMRVVDMVRASLADNRLTTNITSQEGFAPAEEPLDEDGILAAYCRKHKETNPRLANSEDENDLANVLSECMDFVRWLSDHWPVTATMRPSV